MPEATTEVTSSPSIPAHHAARTDIISVTSENFSTYVDEKLGIEPAPDADSPEAVAAKELKEIEAKQVEKDADDKAKADPTHDADLPEEKKRGINERFSKITTAKKEAEERASKAVAEAQAATERANKMEAEAAALKAKYEPVKLEQDPKPNATQFTDIDEYSKALEEWSADNALRNQAKKEVEQRAVLQQELTAKSWQDRQAAIKESIPDYAEAINSSGIEIPNACADVIMESDVGPQILYHLAKNPELANRIKVLSPSKALVEIGKLEARYEKDGELAPSKTATKIAEVSRAPAPIVPIRGGAGASSNKVDSAGEFHGTYEEWKQLRRSGKIK